MAKKQTRQVAQRPVPMAGAAPFLLGLVFFFVLCLMSNTTIKGVVMGLIVAALGVGLVRFPVLRQRIGLPLLLLALVTLMGGISTQYALSGKFGLYEFLKVLGAFCLALLFLSLAPRKEGEGGRWIATVLSCGTALAGLVSIDLLSTRLISTPVLGLLSTFTTDYADPSAVEAGVRMISIFNNPNAFAGCVGLGVILGLGLVQSTPAGKERMAHLVCLFINALAFVLAFSMGASGTILIAFVVYLLAERRERRGALLVLMVETVIPTAVGMALVAMTALDAWDGVEPVPLLCVIGGAAVLCLLDRYVGQKVTEKLQGREKLIWAVIGGVLALGAVFVVLAYNLTGGIRLEAGETLRRGVYPAPGEYTVSVEADGPVAVTITSQNEQETMMHTSTTLYSGALEGAAFTVPEDSRVVYFSFRAEGPVELASVGYDGAESGSVPLGYKLLPGFVANRLQGLWANQNAIQRTVFFEDGMKLFQRSPIWGLGLGSFENGIKGVQSFYYETKYVHNHYIQALVDNGIIGLVLFVGLLAVSAVALFLERKKEEHHVLVPALLAALVFMAGHAAVEVVFSFFSYLPVAFGVFAIINLCCVDTIPMKWTKKAGGIGLLGTIAALLMAFAVLLGCNMSARSMVLANPTLSNMNRAIGMDRFEWADYMLSYVDGSIRLEVDERTRAKADEYALRLAEVDSNTIPVHLAEYYFVTGRPGMAVDMLVKYLDYVASDTSAWNTAFDLLRYYSSDDQAYLDGVEEVVTMMERWNQENMGSIELSEEAQAFLSGMGY